MSNASLTNIMASQSGHVILISSLREIKLPSYSNYHKVLKG